jgi:hypothetical protein
MSLSAARGNGRVGDMLTGKVRATAAYNTPG